MPIDESFEKYHFCTCPSLELDVGLWKVTLNTAKNQKYQTLIKERGRIFHRPVRNLESSKIISPLLDNSRSKRKRGRKSMSQITNNLPAPWNSWAHSSRRASKYILKSSRVPRQMQSHRPIFPAMNIKSKREEHDIQPSFPCLNRTPPLRDLLHPNKLRH